MPKPTKGYRLGGSPTHERIILSNLAKQLFEHGKVTTTETKAKRLRPLAEKCITKAKRGDLHARRLVASTLRVNSQTDKGILHTLFTEIAPMMAEREGGYTRITKVGNRQGDNAPMAVIELVTEKVAPKAKKAAPKAEKPVAAPKAEEKVEETEVVEAPVAENTADVAADDAVIETADAAASVDEVDAEAVKGDDVAPEAEAK